MDGVAYDIAEVPLYFVCSGYVDIDNNRLGNAGLGSDDRSSRANISDVRYAYYRYFGASDVTPSVSASRWHGFSFRCPARL